ncbi:MAG: hypothetical protein JWM11_3655 [Planctomycetaceae bacterium]|nr:hypothetical protein [Planctomycetaceae bacterium]
MQIPVEMVPPTRQGRVGIPFATGVAVSEHN